MAEKVVVVDKSRYHELMKAKSTMWWGVGTLIVALVALVGYLVAVVFFGPSRPTLTPVVVKEESREGRYTLDVHYPELDGLRDVVVEEQVNAAIKVRVDARVAEFVAGAKEIEKPLFPGAVSTLQIEYGVEQLPEQFGAAKSEGAPTQAVLSLVFHELPYYAGAAHPSGGTTSMNIDLRTGRAIELSELFRTESKPFELLAGIARGDLQKQFEPFASKSIGLDDWIAEGTAPKAENYEVFALRKEGLLLVFNPYQVAPYVFGERQVLVPWTTLRASLTPAWQGALADK